MFILIKLVFVLEVLAVVRGVVRSLGISTLTVRHVVLLSSH